MPLLEAMLPALEWRGKDAAGAWDGGDAALAWRGTFLHREDRAEEQPLAGGAGRFHLAFDGRIDNRTELAETLRMGGGAVELPDSAYVMAAWERWGRELIPHLLGDFSLAVWDSVERVLFLSRDHAGTRPLFFHAGDEFVAFASSVGALAACPVVKAGLDLKAFSVWVLMVPLEKTATIYAGVERVPVGGSVVLRERGAEIDRHWDPARVAPLKLGSDAAYLECFESILTSSVRNRLRGDGPVGSHLSGGWDSSTVSIVAAQLLAQEGRSLTAYTGVPAAGWNPARAAAGDGQPDEGPLAGQIAAMHPNMEHVLVPGQLRLDFQDFDAYCDVFELPIRTVSNLSWLSALTQEGARRGVRVMLTGGHGNMTISYDGLLQLAALLGQGRLVQLAKEWRGLHRNKHRYRSLAYNTFGPFLPMALRALASGAMPRLVSMETARMGLMPEVMSGEIEASVRKRLALNFMDSREAATRCATPGDTSQIWSGMLPLWGVEARDAASDRRLLEFRAGVPDSQFLHRGQTKWLGRRFLTGKVPDEVLRVRKRGQQAAEWFDAATASLADLKEELTRIRANEALTTIFDTAYIQRLLDDWPDRPRDTDETIAYRKLVMHIAYARFARRCLEDGLNRIS
jgi:asparagine synthase (glutamine-hydrolysing)